jgi:DNA-binding IclR family transcriptional regulator
LALEENYQALGTQALRRAFAVLGCFSLDVLECSLKEISDALFLPKATVHRLLSALKHLDLLEQDEDTHKYRLGWKLFELGNCVDTLNLLKKKARPYLEGLREKVRETVHLAVLSDTEVLYVDKIMGSHRMTMITSVGLRLPSHVGGLGKCLLAFLPEAELDRVIKASKLRRFTENTITDPEKLKEVLKKVRTNGFAIDNEEVEIGLTCVGVPVMDGNRKVVAAISVSGPKARMDRATMRQHTRMALEEARKISHALGFRDGPVGY